MTNFIIVCNVVNIKYSNSDTFIESNRNWIINVLPYKMGELSNKLLFVNSTMFHVLKYSVSYEVVCL